MATSAPGSPAFRGLSSEQLALWHRDGHVTVPDLFSDSEVSAAVSDIQAWSREFLATLTPDQQAWYLERSQPGQPVLRKLDHPVARREVFRNMACSERLLACVRQLIGDGLRIWFSQVFMKPAHVGGPKPVHQDNYYFGPNDPGGMVTVWIALDDATRENGCLWYASGSHRGPIQPHLAPPDEPFNLQIPESAASQYVLSPTPVPRGGVSFHHGNTLHQSGDNGTDKPRRAVAMHFVNRNTRFAASQLDYDQSLIVDVDSPARPNSADNNEE